MATAMPSAADTLIFYQSIGDELFANNFQANTQYHISVPTTNLTAVQDHIYWQVGRSIYQANPDLTDVTRFHFNPTFTPPTDFTLSPDGNTLYESWGGDLFSIYLPTDTQYHVSLSATNLTAVNGHIYWQDGRSIYQANPDLTDVTRFHFNPTFTPPTDFTLSPDGNTLYESWGGDLFSIYLPTDTQYHVSLSATNLTAVNGQLYWLNGRSIYQANPDLTDVTRFHFDPTFLPPTDLAILDLPTAVPEPSTWAMVLIGFAGLGFAGYRASRKPFRSLSDHFDVRESPRVGCVKIQRLRVSGASFFVMGDVRLTSTPAGGLQRIFYAETFATTIRAISGLSRSRGHARRVGQPVAPPW
jgi:hypothetical protein